MINLLIKYTYLGNESSGNLFQSNFSLIKRLDPYLAKFQLSYPITLVQPLFVFVNGREWERERERERDEKSNQVRVRERGLTAVRPDFGLKISQMSTNGCSENSQSSLFFKNWRFLNSPISRQTFGLLLKGYLPPRTFKSRPILSHWASAKLTTSFLVAPNFEPDY